jgi:hypothetical protein
MKEEDRIAVVASLQAFVDQMDAGLVDVRDLNVTNGFEEVPTRHGDRKRRLTGEQWLTIHYWRTDARNLEPKGERTMGEKIELGSRVKDTVTGAIGTVTAVCEYLCGTTRLMIEGMADGKPFEMWMEKSRCEVVAE